MNFTTQIFHQQHNFCLILKNKVLLSFRTPCTVPTCNMLTLGTPRIIVVTWSKVCFCSSCLVFASYVKSTVPLYYASLGKLHKWNVWIVSPFPHYNFGDICCTAHAFVWEEFVLASNCSVHCCMCSFIYCALPFCFPW